MAGVLRGISASLPTTPLRHGQQWSVVPTQEVLPASSPSSPVSRKSAARRPSSPLDRSYYSWLESAVSLRIPDEVTTALVSPIVEDGEADMLHADVDVDASERLQQLLMLLSLNEGEDGNVDEVLSSAADCYSARVLEHALGGTESDTLVALPRAALQALEVYLARPTVAAQLCSHRLRVEHEQILSLIKNVRPASPEVRMEVSLIDMGDEGLTCDASEVVQGAEAFAKLAREEWHTQAEVAAGGGRIAESEVEESGDEDDRSTGGSVSCDDDDDDDSGGDGDDDGDGGDDDDDDDDDGGDGDDDDDDDTEVGGGTDRRTAPSGLPTLAPQRPEAGSSNGSPASSSPGRVVRPPAWSKPRRVERAVQLFASSSSQRLASSSSQLVASSSSPPVFTAGSSPPASPQPLPTRHELGWPTDWPSEEADAALMLGMGSVRVAGGVGEPAPLSPPIGSARLPLRSFQAQPSASGAHSALIAHAVGPPQVVVSGSDSEDAADDERAVATERAGWPATATRVGMAAADTSVGVAAAHPPDSGMLPPWLQR